MRNKNKAFTLLEALVATATIGALIAIIIPAVGKAKETARRAICASNLRQTGIATTSYALDRNGYMPSNASYIGLIHYRDAFGEFKPVDKGNLFTLDYTSELGIFFCPSADNFTPENEEIGIKNWGNGFVQSSYLYKNKPRKTNMLVNSNTATINDFEPNESLGVDYNISPQKNQNHNLEFFNRLNLDTSVNGFNDNEGILPSDLPYKTIFHLVENK